MRKVFFFIIITLVSVTAINCQSNQTFDCDLLSFEYPSSFKNIPIQQASHMVLKLESKDYFFSISYWDKGYGDEVNAWNDEVYSMYNSFPVDNGSLESVTKETISTRGGDIKCLKLKSNTSKTVQGRDLRIENVSYIVIENGYLYVFTFMSNGAYSRSNSKTYPDNIMEGLKLKHPTQKNEIIDDLDDHLLEVVKSLNAQCPVKADECTTFENVILSGKTITIKTVIPDECEPFIDIELFKNRMCSNFSKALDRRFFEYLKEKQYSVVYMVYNEYNEYKNRVSISPQDVLYYYE